MKKVISIGHRGATGHAPENTLTSFKKALELGADMIELDVHVCKSGEIIVMHDEKVNRTTNGKGHISKKSLKELKNLTIKKIEKIPTLIEVLNLVNRKCKINIELKGKGTEKPVSKIIKKYIQKGWSYNDFLVSSFYPSKITEIKNINPKIRIGILVEKISLEIIALAKKFKVYSINPNIKSISKKFVKKAHQKRLKIFVYTVNKPGKIKKMKELGVDGIISDFPDRI